MNWQTKEVQDWLKKSAIVHSLLSAEQIQNLVESLLLERHNGSATNYLRRLMTLNFLDSVEWKKLVIVPKTEEELRVKLKEFQDRLEIKEGVS